MPSDASTIAPAQSAVTLDDKYSKFDGRVYLTGIQAWCACPCCNTGVM